MILSSLFNLLLSLYLLNELFSFPLQFLPLPYQSDIVIALTMFSGYAIILLETQTKKLLKSIGIAMIKMMNMAYPTTG